MKSIQVFKGENGQHYFRVKADNGKTVAQSEGYKSRRNAVKTANRLKVIIAGAKIVKL